jgi:TonB family protein
VRAPRGRCAAGLVLAVLAPAAALAQTTEGLGGPRPGEQPAQIDASKLSKAPKQTKFVEADYPPEATAKGIEADVVLLLDINAQGKVDSASIAEPATPAGMGFDEAALVAAQQFEFEPAEVQGKPIAVQLSYRYKFRLKAKPAEPPAGAPGAAPGAPAAPARAPVANFTGFLRERGTRLPMPGVLVTVFREQPTEPGKQAEPSEQSKPGEQGKQEGYEATSDASGHFKFFDLGPGEWKVLVEAPGYYPFRTSETIAANEALDVSYFVERGSYNPFDVTVTATRPRKEVSRTVIGAKEIDKVPGTFGDPLAVVQNFAGVARLPFNGQIIVRGSAPEDTQVFVDGAGVPLIYHFGGLKSVIPVGMLEAIEFYPGNFSTTYGRATGGIIDVQIKKLKPPKIGGYADVSILDTSLYLEAPLGDKAAIAIAGRRSYIDFILDVAVPDDAPVNLVTAPRYYDYQVLANYRPTPANDLRAFFFGSNDLLRLLFENPADFDTTLMGSSASNSTNFYRGILTHRFVPSERFENTVRLSAGKDSFDIKFFQFIIDVDLTLVQLRDNMRVKIADWMTLVAGFDGGWSTSDFLVQLPLPPKEGQPMGNENFSQVRRSQGTEDFFYPAGYVELELRPLPGLLLIPGLRVDYLANVAQTIAQPRVTGRWELVPGFTAKGGAGLYTQEPDPFQGEMDDVFGNPWLSMEKAQHYSVGVEWKPREHLTFDVTGFYKRLHQLISSTDDVVTIDGQTRPLVYDNKGRGRVYGMEVVARHEFANNFTGWVAYTLSRALRTDSGKTEERLFDYDQTHILTLVGSYRLPRNWMVGSRFRLVSGNPYTPVVNAVNNLDTDRYDPVFGKVNSRRNGAFHQLDLRVDKMWVYKDWMLSAYVDIQNVYNRANPEGRQYNFNFRQSKAQQGLPLLIIPGIRGEF